MNPRAVSITTVLAAVKSRDLIGLDDVKTALGLADGSADVFLTKQITFASAAIAQHCNRVFQVEQVKDEFWPARDAHLQVIEGVAPLQLSRWPVQEITEVLEFGSVLTDGTDYRIDAEDGQLHRLDGISYPRRWLPEAISVTYSAGFDPIPPDVQDAAIRLVSARYHERGRDPYLRRKAVPGVSDKEWWIPNGPNGNLTPDIADILDNYRVPVIA